MRGVADGVQGNERKQEVARGEAGGGRGSVGERHASPLLVLLAEEEEDKGGGGGLGRLGGELGRLVGCTGEARYVLLPLIFVLFYFFLFLQFVFDLF